MDRGSPIRENHWISTDPSPFHSALPSQEITIMDTRTNSTATPSTFELDALIVATDILLDDALPKGVQNLLIAGVLARI
ncbi:hypothetical protein C0Z11_09005 [Acidipropionibacterium jensenii]|nr:hypothetical protein C0Z11_09005 [Acidipropionibacterium jensenii]